MASTSTGANFINLERAYDIEWIKSCTVPSPDLS